MTIIKKNRWWLILALIIIGIFAVIKFIEVPTYHLNGNQINGDKNLPEPISSSPEKIEIILAFGGDVMLSRGVYQQMIKKQNFIWPFLLIGEIFQTADLSIINLESPFLKNNDYFVPTGSFSFKADPRSIVGLTWANIGLVSLANNHFGNQGQKGMTDTFAILEAAGVKYVGAGQNADQARQGEIFEIKGLKFGFLGFGYPESLYVATADAPGIANLNWESAAKAINQLKKEVDFLIVLMHAGTEYTAQPNNQQKKFGRAAIEAGADAVIGHHPHWVQTIEIYQEKPILYSLGNLVFDQMWSRETRQGAIARLYFSDQGLMKLEILPTIIEDYGQPRLVTDNREKEIILKRMGVTEDWLSWPKN